VHQQQFAMPGISLRWQCSDYHRALGFIIAAILARLCLATEQSQCHLEAACPELPDMAPLVASNLLQVHTGVPVPRTGPADVSEEGISSAPGPYGMRKDTTNARRSHAILTAPDPQPEAPTHPPIQEVLPQPLIDLGLQLLGSEETLNELVAASHLENFTYAGVPLSLRTMSGEYPNTSIAQAADRYELDTLPVLSPTGMLQMLDIGANYGAVAIAAFKKFPDRLRAVVVEPIPTTFFLLHWNMWLNGVTQIPPDEGNVSTPGIMALNRGLADADDKVVGFCYLPPYTTNAFACDCHLSKHNGPDQCQKVTSISTQSLMQLFGAEPIAFVKIDCEGCETDSLPAMVNVTQAEPGRIKRLAGELHAPPPELLDLACQYDSGSRFVKVCIKADGEYDSAPLRCNEERGSCENDMPFLEQLRLFHN
jgi:FkbM family methyltransferase